MVQNKKHRRTTEMASGAELTKYPCPFCGSSSVRTYSRARKNAKAYWVQCVCGVRGKSAFCRAAAGAEWNKRASVKPPSAHAFHRVIEDCDPCCCCGSQPEVVTYNVGSQIRCTNPKCFTAVGFDGGRYNPAELIEMWDSLHEIGEGSDKIRMLKAEDV